MAYNEVLILLTSIASIVLVLLAWRLDKERLYSAILIFLILIALTGGKIVEFFGHETNTGNIFYASVFLATYFLIERYGKREGIRSIWIGLVGVLLFSILLWLTTLYIPSASTAVLSAALETAFAPLSRLAFASVLAYIISQTLNVYLYIYLKQKFNGGKLWLRANLANLAAQAVDSVIFFTVAFWGVIAPTNIHDVIITGFVIKVLFMMVASPLLYLNTIEEDHESEYTSLTVR